jgi:hypothetical protein
MEVILIIVKLNMEEIGKEILKVLMQILCYIQNTKFTHGLNEEKFGIDKNL